MIRPTWLFEWDHVKRILGGFPLLAGYALLRSLPSPLVSWIGAQVWGMRALRPSFGERRKPIVAFSHRVYPTLTDDARDAWARGYFCNVGRQRFEIALGADFCRSRYLTTQGETHLQAARATQRPLILPFVHLGNWKVTIATVAACGLPMVQIFRPERNPIAGWIVDDFRRRCGIHTLDLGYRGAAGALRALRSGRAVMLAVDELHERRINAPGFGRRGVGTAGNISIAVRLAHATDALLVPVFTLRVRGIRMSFHTLPPIDLREDAEGAPPTAGERRLSAATLAAGIQRLERAFAPIILANLDQWGGLMSIATDRFFRGTTRQTPALRPDNLL